MMREGPIRKRLQNFLAGQPEDSRGKILAMRERKQQEWSQKYTPKLVSMAIDLADNRARGTAAIVPDRFTEARNAVLVEQYSKSLDAAEEWLESSQK